VLTAGAGDRQTDGQSSINKCVGDDTKAAARQIPNCIKKTKKNKIWRKTIFNMADKFLHPAMYHDHDIDFAMLLYPAMWQVALG